MNVPVTLTPMCLCFLLRSAGSGHAQVLLGRKKRGFGAGKVVGMGGHVEAGESARAAAVREVAEECGLAVDAENLDERATVVFRFPTRPGWDQQVVVFVVDRWSGELTESGEIEPMWCDVDPLPLDLMWDDTRYWLPGVLLGERLTAEMVFHDDSRTVAQARVRPLL